VAIVVIGFGFPILVTLVGKLPYMTGVYDKLKPYLIYPSTVGSYQVRPLPGLLGNAPTIGQALYIIGLLVLNLVLTFIGYESVAPLPHPWGYKPGPEWLAYAGYRTGDLAFALLPLTILFAGRNNILLWATNWSHATYLLLHRWVARIFVLQTLLHSVFLLVAYIRNGIFAMNKNTSYWQWGIVGTVAACTMPVFSALFFRRLSYEAFLIYHIISAVFVIVGSWYHLIYRFGLTNSHEYWLYAACAVWFFDRLIRVLRIAKNGLRRASVTEIGDGHVRVDVQGLRWATKPGYHAYAYFPTVNILRPWENHPFSVNATSLFNTLPTSPTSSLKRSSSEGHDIEKSPGHTTETRIAVPVITTNAGITFIIRKNTGLTKHLQKHASLLTLIDGPYRNNVSDSILKCDRVVLIGGGIGITGLLSWTLAHPNIKLAWSLKESASAVLKEVEGVLSGIADKEVLVGQRVDVDALLRAEVGAGCQRIGVVVCGPGGLCDDVRARVASLGRHEKTVFELEVHAYSW
jgi:predicted ferric reductase